MININRDESKVIVRVDNGPLNSTYSFIYDCGNKFYASLLSDRLSNEFHSLVEAVRKEEYERGYKDGRGRKEKKSWFNCTLIRCIYGN